MDKPKEIYNGLKEAFSKIFKGYKEYALRVMNYFKNLDKNSKEYKLYELELMAFGIMILLAVFGIMNLYIVVGWIFGTINIVVMISNIKQLEIEEKDAKDAKNAKNFR